VPVFRVSAISAYLYDAENHLIADDQPAYQDYYLYDAEGRRVRRISGGWTFDYVYDLNGTVISEMDGLSPDRLEIYAPGRHLATENQCETVYNHADWLGTERVRTNASDPQAPRLLATTDTLAHRSDPYQPASSYATFPRERGGRATVTAQIVEHVQASVGIRKWMRLILNDMNFPKTGKLQFAESSEPKAKASPNEGLDSAVTSQTASMTPSPSSPGLDSKPAYFPFQASVGIRKRMRLILNDMRFSRTGKLQFTESSQQKAKASPSKGPDATVTSQTASMTPFALVPGHESKPAYFPIQASVGIRKWIRLILNDMNFSKAGKLQFIDSLIAGVPEVRRPGTEPR
jgi:YD repeat-containing protein